ncbi:hypothetical protein KIW84_042688 [Lathyrus oleraceus]|uniref:Phosphoglycerate mutase n=1 Tax=Pisum sativum TaxID=3888 RepID=A0A9D4XFX0_PEA|nr:hypothetical protein KIW84_042688 [Pisum sativum]
MKLEEIKHVQWLINYPEDQRFLQYILLTCNVLLKLPRSLLLNVEYHRFDILTKIIPNIMAEFDSCEFQVVKDFDLRERHKGDLQGLSHLEIAKTNPISYKALMSKNEEQEIPGGGESIVQLLERCKSALLRIGQKYKGERVVVVSHGASIEILYKWACVNGYEGKIHNASISVFHLYDEDKWNLKVWADVSHLSQS